MSDLHAFEPEVEPGAVGFDARRLNRIHDFYRPYVDDGRLPGWSVLVSRHGRIAHFSGYGRRDVEQDRAVEPDTLWRLYSMTKPVTSVAAMMLYEEGAFDLLDPISRWLPAFRDMRVYTGGSAQAPSTEPATEPIRVRHLLTHTAGLTYGFHRVHPVDEMYRRAGLEFGAPDGTDLAAVTDLWASLPLVYQPGREWIYSVATDVLGRLVEVVSGTSLDRFFAERIFGPLGMTDTGFALRPGDLHRLAALYSVSPGPARMVRNDQLGDVVVQGAPFLSGGGGLVGTIGDYHRFTQFMRGGGQLDGVRLLGDRTLRYMASNHLPGGVDLARFARPLFTETRYDGMGFGLGFSVLRDPVAYGVLSSPGEFAWGGLASTAFWVDPVEDVTAVFMTSLVPSGTYPLRTQLRQLVYSALTGS